MGMSIVKRFAGLCLILATFALPQYAGAAAYTNQVDGTVWRYFEDKFNPGTVMLGTGQWTYGAIVDKNISGEIVLPTSLGGYPVAKLDSYAFFGYTGITGVTIPGCIEKMLEDTFKGCTNLTNVVMENGVKDLGYSAFKGCTALEEISLPDSVTNMNMEAFGNCTSLRRVRLSRNLKNTGSSSFLNCASLTDVEIPEGVEIIGINSFQGCTALADVSLPGSVTNIKPFAFEGCVALTSVVLPDGVKGIDGSAFANCATLQSVKIGAGLSEIGEGAFSGCVALREFVVSEDNPYFKSENGLLLTKDGKRLIAGVNGDVVIPDGVETIGESAFSGFGDLTSVQIPGTVASIGSSAFANCRALTQVLLPSSLKSIGANAFNLCDSLVGIEIPDSVTEIGAGAFEWCGELKYARIGAGVESIGDNAFRLCTNLVEDVTIPNSVTMLGQTAFGSCTSLRNASLPFSLKQFQAAYNFFDACQGLTVSYRQVEVGDTIFFSNVHNGSTLSSQWNVRYNPVINESNFDFQIPASDQLPAGVKLRIKRIAFNSLNETFKVWSPSDSKTDPSYVRLNGVNSGKYELGGTLFYRDYESQIVSFKSILSYTFSSECNVIVGTKYAAVEGNNIGGVGNGLAFLADNQKLVYGTVNGVAADRASVTYVNSGDIISTTTADTITAPSSGYHPLYRIEAEVVALEPSVLDGTPLVAYNDIETGENNFNAWRNVPARTQPFSFALYADVSKMPSEGKPIILEFGNKMYDSMAILYRDGDKVKFAFGKMNEIISTPASVEAKPGKHLYTAVCDPSIGKVALRLDGGDESMQTTGSAVTLGYGFQIGAFYHGMDNVTLFRKGTNLSVVMFKAFDAVFTQRDIAALVEMYPAERR